MDNKLKRPTGRDQQHRQPRLPSYDVPPREYFKQEVFGGRLWHQECQQAASGDLSDEIPLQFANIDRYISTFDPLVLEEAREGLKADWSDSCAADSMIAVDINK